MTSSAKCTACNQRALLLASLPYLGVIFPFDRAVLREKKKKKKVFAWNAEGSGHCLLLAKVSILIFVEQRERYPCCHISEGGGEGKRGGRGKLRIHEYVVHRVPMLDTAGVGNGVAGFRS